MLDYFRGYKPSWLYEPLPYLYAAAGLLTMLLVRNAVALLSGAMLITAGGIVWYSRKRHREAASARSAESRKSPGMVDIVWRPSFRCGIKEIDDQHRALFATANVLMDDITNREPPEVVNDSLRGLIRDIQAHFKTEEAILEKAVPTLVESHRTSHARLLREARRISDRIFEGTASMNELAGFVVYDVVADHLAKEDALFIAEIRGHEK